MPAATSLSSAACPAIYSDQMCADAGEDGQGSSVTAVKFEARGHSRFGSNWDDGVYSDVKRLRIRQNIGGVCFIQIEYIDKNGESGWSAEHGYPNHTDHKVVALNYPNEYLTSIHGYDNGVGIASLTLETNKQTWGPYGKENGTKFSFPIIGAKIVGFHGRSGSSLNAIGVYVQPISKSMRQLQPQPQPLSLPPHEHFSLGQYGHEDGEFWEETFRAIKRLIIYSTDQWINSIQMEYEDENGKLMLSNKHGGDGGTPKEVVFEYPDEHLITIQGYYDNSIDSKSATNMIRSLTVMTNKNTYGPYGFDSFEDGTKFLFPIDGRLKVVGIHGRSDKYLNAIGLNAMLI